MQPASPIASPPSDEDLLCLACEYNLAGLDSSVCPECGTPIDWPGVRRARDRRMKWPPVPWERWPWHWKIPGFVMTAMEVALEPWRFVRRLPDRPRVAYPIAFFIICLAWQVAWFDILDVGGREGMAYPIGVGTQVLAQVLLFGLLIPVGRIRVAFRFWLVVSCYTSYPLLVEAFSEALPAILFEDAAKLDFVSTIWPFDPAPDVWVPTVMFYLWWSNLLVIGALAAPNRHRRRAILVILALPMLVVGSSYSGCYLAGMLD